MEVSRLYLLDERIKTFKNWPFSDKEKCNVRRMAEAGFYSISTGVDDADTAKCFLCGKELDGWEASDDPWAEHKSHAAKCAFVQIGKNEDNLLVPEFLSIAKQYMINELHKFRQLSNKEIDDHIKLAKRRLK